METNKFKFNFYRFIGTPDNRTTEITRDITTADGMRGLVDMKADQIKLATERAIDWATSRETLTFPIRVSCRSPGRCCSCGVTFT